MIQLKGLDTEQVNPLTAHIDQEDTQGILRLINQEDRRVAGAVAPGNTAYCPGRGCDL